MSEKEHAMGDKIMRIDNAGEWQSKVNFVDTNNVVVGYDMDQQCCELASYEWQDEQGNELPDNQVLEGYVFDPGYCEHKIDEYYDEGGAVVFRAVGDGLPTRYLVLSNSHNGYYSHGFDMRRGDDVLHDGSL